ncbi:MAG: serine/threonine protein kinase [Candidatus Magasanikbacteria bacterium]|nr:serine/threonine protein kinase [Candidatus Magasanikbacteria bacterium]
MAAAARGQEEPKLAPNKGDVLEGRFEIGEELGRGGFAAVYSALDNTTGHMVAIKIPLPTVIFGDESVLKRFHREATFTQSIQSPHVAETIHTGSTDILHKKVPYMVMELLKGRDLHQRIEIKGHLSQDETVQIMVQTLHGLEAAHDKGIIHRDLKPENIFICDTDQETGLVVKVVDFGIAKALDDESSHGMTKTGLVAGTAEYMAPEQAAGTRDFTFALDIYAIGCIMFEMLTGNPPYTGTSPMSTALKHLSDPIPEVPDRFKVAFEIKDIIRRAMSKDPKARYQTAAEMLGDLLPFLPQTVKEEPLIAPDERTKAFRISGFSLATEEESLLDEGDLIKIQGPPPIPELPVKRDSALLQMAKDSKPPLVALGLVGLIVLLFGGIAILGMYFGGSSDELPTPPTIATETPIEKSTEAQAALLEPQEPTRKDTRVHEELEKPKELPGNSASPRKLKSKDKAKTRRDKVSPPPKKSSTKGARRVLDLGTDDNKTPSKGGRRVLDLKEGGSKKPATKRKVLDL